MKVLSSSCALLIVLSSAVAHAEVVTDDSKAFTVTSSPAPGSAPTYTSKGTPSDDSKTDSRFQEAMQADQEFRGYDRNQNYLGYPRSRSREMTGLRVVGSPTGTFRTYDISRRGVHLFLEKVEVQVRNVGSAQAKGISVYAKLPTGGSMNLSGPTILGPNQIATYVSRVRKEVKSQESIKAEVSCTNCYKR